MTYFDSHTFHVLSLFSIVEEGYHRVVSLLQQGNFLLGFYSFPLQFSLFIIQWILLLRKII